MQNDYDALRRQLRAFHGADIHVCPNQRRLTMATQGVQRVEQYAADHPEADALDLRGVVYDYMEKNYLPVVFPESPFYFENGGYGATWAAPIASLMIEKYIRGYTVREDLEKRIMEGRISYKNER